MGTWPIGSSVTTANVDQTGDKPGQARANIENAFLLINAIIAAYGDLAGVCDLDGGGAVPEARLANALKLSQNLAELPNKASARANLGATSLGEVLFTIGSAAGARTALGALSLGGGSITGNIMLGGSPLITQAILDAYTSIGGNTIHHDGNFPRGESGEFTFSPGQAFGAPHGMPSTPSLAWAVLVCKEAEFGYVVGDVVTKMAATHSTINTVGLEVFADAVNVSAVVGDSGINVYRRDAPIGRNVVVTPAKWRVVLRAI